MTRCCVVAGWRPTVLRLVSLGLRQMQCEGAGIAKCSSTDVDVLVADGGSYDDSTACHQVFQRQLKKSGSVSKALEAVVALQRDAKAGTVRTLEEEKRLTSLVSCRLLSRCKSFIEAGRGQLAAFGLLTSSCVISAPESPFRKRTSTLLGC